MSTHATIDDSEHQLTDGVDLLVRNLTVLHERLSNHTTLLHELVIDDLVLFYWKFVANRPDRKGTWIWVVERIPKHVIEEISLWQVFRQQDAAIPAVLHHSEMIEFARPHVNKVLSKYYAPPPIKLSEQPIPSRHLPAAMLLSRDTIGEAAADAANTFDVQVPTQVPAATVDSQYLAGVTDATVAVEQPDATLQEEEETLQQAASASPEREDAPAPPATNMVPAPLFQVTAQPKPQTVRESNSADAQQHVDASLSLEQPEAPSTPQKEEPKNAASARSATNDDPSPLPLPAPVEQLKLQAIPESTALDTAASVVEDQSDAPLSPQEEELNQTASISPAAAAQPELQTACAPIAMDLNLTSPVMEEPNQSTSVLQGPVCGPGANEKEVTSLEVQTASLVIDSISPQTQPPHQQGPDSEPEQDSQQEEIESPTARTFPEETFLHPTMNPMGADFDIPVPIQNVFVQIEELRLLTRKLFQQQIANQQRMSMEIAQMRDALFATSALIAPAAINRPTQFTIAPPSPPYVRGMITPLPADMVSIRPGKRRAPIRQEHIACAVLPSAETGDLEILRMDLNVLDKHFDSARQYWDLWVKKLKPMEKKHGHEWRSDREFLVQGKDGQVSKAPKKNSRNQWYSVRRPIWEYIEYQINENDKSEQEAIILAENIFSRARPGNQENKKAVRKQWQSEFRREVALLGIARKRGRPNVKNKNVASRGVYKRRRQAVKNTIAGMNAFSQAFPLMQEDELRRR